MVKTLQFEEVVRQSFTQFFSACCGWCCGRCGDTYDGSSTNTRGGKNCAGQVKHSRWDDTLPRVFGQSSKPIRTNHQLSETSPSTYLSLALNDVVFSGNQNSQSTIHPTSNRRQNKEDAAPIYSSGQTMSLSQKQILCLQEICLIDFASTAFKST